MKQFIVGTIDLVLMSIASLVQVAAQPRFEIPITVTDGVTTRVLHFGILPTADFCIVRRDSINGNGEFFLPPVSPSGTFDARIVWPRPVSGGAGICFDQGSLNDYRPFISVTQKDTFKVQCQAGASNSVSVSWPNGLSAYFQHLNMEYRSFTMLDSIDMLAQSSIAVTNATIIWLQICSSNPRGTALVGQDREGFPMQAKLFQNNPNPFNPETSIKFQIPSSSFVSLKVYDVLGREVATLVDEELDAGKYSVEWNPDGLSSGMYIYRITTAGATLSKKMLLLR